MTPRQTPVHSAKRPRARKAVPDASALDITSWDDDAKEKARQQDRINRRRTQNRISQQCIREKAQAHAKQLEALSEMVKPIMQTDGSSDGSSQTALIQNQLLLIEENKELREALLQMRKKLLSLSSAASAVADHPVFNQLLKGGSMTRPQGSRPDDIEHNKTDPSQTRENTGPRCEDVNKGPHNSSSRSPDEGPLDLAQDQNTNDLPWREDSHAPFPKNTASSAHPAVLVGCQNETDCTLQDQNRELDSSQIFDSGFLDLLTSGPYSSSAPSSQNLTTESLFWTNPQQMLSMIPAFETGCMGHRSNFFAAAVSRDMIELAHQIEDGCISYLRKTAVSGSDQILELGPENTKSYGDQRALGACPDLLAEISKVGVYLTVRVGGRSSYVYGTGANEVMEKVFRWRCCPTLQNRRAIPEPFRPTTLQTLSMNHPNIIDFLNWPSIRDQLIYKHGTYDVEEIFSDLLLNTVIEIPQFQISVNILDTFISRVFNSTSSSSGGRNHDRDPTFFSLSATPSTPTIRLEELPRRCREHIVNIVKEMPANAIPRLNLKSLPLTQNHFQRHQLASKWGLYQLISWKVSREFATAHPEIDCSSVVSRYPMCSSNLVPEL